MGYVPSYEALPWPCCGSCVPLRGSTAAPGPAGPPPPPPDEGAGARTGPPKGIVPSCYCAPPPPPRTGRHRRPPPSTLECPLWWWLQQCRTPLCPLHDLHAGALCSSHRVCIGRHGCSVRFSATRCALFCGGEGGEGGRSCLGCPGTTPGGEGRSSSTCAAEVSASAPYLPPPRGWGWGSTDVPCCCPPPLGGGGVRNPGGGGGSMPSHLADDPARAAVSRREMSPKISACPREGGGDVDAVVPPPRVCGRPGALPARVTPAPIPRVPPLARRFPLGGAGRAGRAA